MSYKAWRVEVPSGPFHKVELPHTVLGPNQVRVRVAASGLNPLDTKIRAAQAGHAKHPLPAVLGIDMAGFVEELFPSVTSFRLGDEVYGMAGGVGGHQGTLSESMVVDAGLLAHKPANLSMREAAALPLSVITAWEGLVDRAKVHEGQTVLIHAGAGGVGHIAVQIARAFGAHVFATVSADKAKIVESYGAVAIDYRVSSAEDYAAAHTGNDGFDIVYDTVGGATLDASFTAVKRYSGHVISCLGWGSHSLAPLSFRGASYSGVFTLLPLLSGIGHAHHGEILTQAAKLAEQGKLRPLLSQAEFTIDTIETAFDRVQAGSLGKVVIDL